METYDLLGHLLLGAVLIGVLPVMVSPSKSKTVYTLRFF